MKTATLKLASTHSGMYGLPVAANSATGFGDPNELAHWRPSNPKAGAFFVPASSSYGGCAWDTLGYAGFRVSRFANLRTAATQYRLATIRGSSTTHGAIPMHSIRTIRAAAHRRMAFAALNADSSLSTRLARYTHHITKARALEAVGGAQ